MGMNEWTPISVRQPRVNNELGTPWKQRRRYRDLVLELLMWTARDSLRPKVFAIRGSFGPSKSNRKTIQTIDS